MKRFSGLLSTTLLLLVCCNSSVRATITDTFDDLDFWDVDGAVRIITGGDPYAGVGEWVSSGGSIEYKEWQFNGYLGQEWFKYFTIKAENKITGDAKLRFDLQARYPGQQDYEVMLSDWYYAGDEILWRPKIIQPDWYKVSVEFITIGGSVAGIDNFSESHYCATPESSSPVLYMFLGLMGIAGIKSMLVVRGGERCA